MTNDLGEMSVPPECLRVRGRGQMLGRMGWLIFLRVILSVSANAVQKRLLLNRAGVYHTWILTYLFMLGPAVGVALWFSPLPAFAFWGEIVLGGGLDALGNLAMVAALRVTDISVFGPLNALRPILALFFGWVFLGESPTALGMAGVAITVFGGVILFSDKEGHHARGRLGEVARALFLRVTGLSLGVVGAVFLKRAATYSSAQMTVAAWIVCGLVVLTGAAALHRRADLTTLGSAARTHVRWLGVHAVCFLTMQWLTIRIFQETLLAYSFVYFQLAIVLQVFIGRIFFKERAFKRRLVASMIMATGSVLVLWKG
jgi:drug/metabolite transporter (DMT)-like permease